MKYNDRFDPYDMSAGKYSSHKVPKWDRQTAGLMGEIAWLMDLDNPENPNMPQSQSA